MTPISEEKLINLGFSKCDIKKSYYKVISSDGLVQIEVNPFDEEFKACGLTLIETTDEPIKGKKTFKTKSIDLEPITNIEALFQVCYWTYGYALQIKKYGKTKKIQLCRRPSKKH